MGSILEWEENLFLGIKALYRRLVVGPQERRREAVRARLEPMRQELFLLARMVAGRPVVLVETPRAVLCDGTHLFLPDEFSAAASPAANEELYRLKTILGALALRKAGDMPPADRLAEWSRECPGLVDRIEAARASLVGAADLWSLFGEPVAGGTDEQTPSVAASLAEAAEDAGKEEINEIEGRGQIGVKSIEEGDDQPVEAEMPIHTFEKAETLEEYGGLDRKKDDDDELHEHEEALRSVDMNRVLRSRERPRSIYRADVVLEGVAMEVADDAAAAGIPYPEWDYQRRRHKPDWCFVRETRASAADPGWAVDTAARHRAVILDLRKKLASLANRAQRAKRQPHGPELDIDAVVRMRSDLAAGRTPDERIYVERCRRLHDVSALILMDLSFSTDSWIDDARVLDTIRETLFCAGEVLDEFIEGFAVAGFSSNTRRQCEFHLIKDFRENWAASRAKLGSLESRGYTRIGPALRHAQELVSRESGERKIVFLLTDGRPCDYDRYEGEYGIRDVRKAIETGARHGILTHAFAIEQRAREQFPRMFKRNHYDIVPSPRALAASLCGAFARLRLGD
jgi:nitric oxide reductase NorD protein